MEGLRITKAEKDRIKEITEILHKHELLKGITPEKLRGIFEDLGPTYVKLGQVLSLHSDILPQQYCNELMKLQSNVPPMPFYEVEEVLESAYGSPWHKIFSEIKEKPIGAGSIAQVHKAVLKNGEKVVLKIQRKGIHEIMDKDIDLLRKAVKLITPLTFKSPVDLDMVLNELWSVAQDEMDFLKEASNMEEFSRCNKDVAFVRAPNLYREYTTVNVLVMEFIDGFAINDTEKLLANGYDLNEVGSKFADNFFRQVMDDGFFHADPHPGNVRVLGGKIVWLDMGMMGRLSKRDKVLISQAVKGIADNDCLLIQEAVMGLGDFRGKPDQQQLYKYITDLMGKYGTMDMATMDVTVVLEELVNVMKENHIFLPHGMTMLVRGLTTIKGVLTEISPDINVTEVATARIRADYFDNKEWKDDIKKDVKRLRHSFDRAIDIPALLADILHGYINGQRGFNLDLTFDNDSSALITALVQKIVVGLWGMALLISSSIICMTDMKPKVLGIPALGFFGYLLAVIMIVYVFVKQFFHKKK